MKKLLAGFFIFTIFLSCKKEQQSFCIDALIRWGGDPAADGAGWYFIADSTRSILYFPRNLPDSLKIDNLLVNTCLYKTKEKFISSGGQTITKYHVTAIRRL